MWNKDEPEGSKTTTVRHDEGKPVERSVSAKIGASGDRATIGRSITIKGDISGDEDLYIQGSVDGSVKLKEHNVTISSEGRIKADIHARTITVQGHVEGDLFGEEQVILSPSCRVRGNITAPRVALEDGANFRGTIDMEAKSGDGPPAARRASLEQVPAKDSSSVKTSDLSGTSDKATDKKQ